MSKNYPMIGIPCRLDTSETYPGRPIQTQNTAYLNAVQQAGGLPILIPLNLTDEQLDMLIEQVDALLFAGGGDIDPNYYQQSPQVDNLTDIQPERDDTELRLMRLATETKMPFLAICRGIQIMNVANGGTLWQDIPSQRPECIRHDYFYDSEVSYPRHHIAHEMRLNGASRLRDIVQTDCFAVNSLHHQNVREVAPNLKAVGQAQDGLIEVLEAIDHPFGIGVQWHPEELVNHEETARKLFKAFIEAAR